jgi:hydroxypyruvate reductase
VALDQLRADARAIFRAGVEAADPGAAVKSSLRFAPGGGILVAGKEVSPPGTLRALAVGKAASTMARALVESVPPSLFPGPGIVVVNDENREDVERFLVMASGHPLPDARGEAAAREVERYVSGAWPEDGLLVLLSGGGSALLPAPAEGLVLQEKIQTTKLLLECGASIQEVNTVRKHLSRLKGGGLAARAQPAAVETLLLSDVAGDDLSSIASGLTAPDPTTYEDAREVLVRRGIWDKIPVSARARIEKGLRGEIPETPKEGNKIFARVENRIVGSNRLSLDAAASKAAELGYRVEIASRELVGEARGAALSLAQFFLEPSRRAFPSTGPMALLAGGETTVTIRGSGRGGRNQELALALCLEMARLAAPLAWAFLSGGTDGRDGPTDAAGGIVDSETLERGKRLGLDPVRALDENDSYPFLSNAGDLLKTGPTGTNVADLQIFLLG